MFASKIKIRDLRIMQILGQYYSWTSVIPSHFSMRALNRIRTYYELRLVSSIIIINNEYEHALPKHAN
jgi:hypothetical protein